MFSTIPSENNSAKLYGKIYFYCKSKKETSSSQTASKYEEVRKIVLPNSYVEFMNQIMLSLSKEKAKHHFSDSSVSNFQKHDSLTFKYLDEDEKWTTFSSQEDYTKALSLCSSTKSNCLRMKVYYKKSMFKLSSKKAKKSEDCNNASVHNLTVCSDFREFQKLLMSGKSNDLCAPISNTSTTSSSSATPNQCIFQFWTGSCLESKA
ncbi:hypothetical protein ABK040_004334 [Willaertia magna]